MVTKVLKVNFMVTLKVNLMVKAIVKVNGLQ